MHALNAEELIGKNLSIFHSEEQMPRVHELNVLLKKEGRYVAEEVWQNEEGLTLADRAWGILAANLPFGGGFLGGFALGFKLG